MNQFDLQLDTGTARAPLTLVAETTTEAPTPQPQPDLLSVPPQPAAKDLAAWERRQHGGFRARQMRRNILRRAGDNSSHEDRCAEACGGGL